MTIKDIAKKTGFAISTVSRALNNHPDVSSETKRKINEVVEYYGFVPNSNARQLKAQQTRNIFIIVKGAFNLFFVGILEQIEEELTKAGHAVNIHYIDEDANELDLAIKMQRENKPLAFLFLGGVINTFKEKFSEIAVPSVLATTYIKDYQCDNLISIGINDIKAGKLAGEYLYNNGHTDIVVLGGNLKKSYISAMRYKGFCDFYNDNCAAKHNISYKKCSFNMGSAHRAMSAILQESKKPTAVFCLSDVIAMGAIRAVHDANLKVPKHISVLGFDGLDMGKYCIPGLSTIHQPQEKIAEYSIHSLLQAIAGMKLSESKELKAQLVERESVKNIKG